MLHGERFSFILKCVTNCSFFKFYSIVHSLRNYLHKVGKKPLEGGTIDQGSFQLKSIDRTKSEFT